MILKPVSYTSLLVFLLVIPLLNTRLVDAGMVRTTSESIRYAAESFDWQTLEVDNLKVNWYEGDANFGQSALDAASAGLESIHSLMPLDLAQPVEIFIYANVEDLRSTLPAGSEAWVAGHADPSLGVVMVVIEPGAQQSLRMEQRIPHELMHVMMYRQVGAGYKNIPAWLREGTAALAEIYPNPDYERVLIDAASKNMLIPLSDLCIAFPPDAAQAFLAYAESRSFTKSLHDSYGSTGLLHLAQVYADGVDCEHGIERAFGISLSSLESNWGSSVLGQNSFLEALKSISPYLVLLCLVLIIPLISIVTTLRKKGTHSEPGPYIRK